MDEAWQKLIEEFKIKAREARVRANKLSYKQRSVQSQYNTEAHIYESCARRLKEEYERVKRSSDAG